MSITELTDEAKLELLKKILHGLLGMEDDHLLELVNDAFLEYNLVDYFDYLDEDDFFGTEGWKNRFDVRN